MQNSFHCGIEVNVEQLLLFCGTFNVGAKAPPLDSLRPWLFLDHQLCHIYVITLQEIVELNGLLKIYYIFFYLKFLYQKAKHFILTDDTNQKLWNQKILDELGNNFDMIYQQGSVNVGRFNAKNKGAIGLSILLKGRPICFIASHLNSGRNKNDRREEDYQNIINNIFKEDQKEKNNLKLLNHDFCFWMGDLNFRLDSRIQRIQIEEMLVMGEIDKLLGYDQLSRSRLHKKAFHDFEEMKISFGPTYRFDVQSHIFDTSKKQQIPAWCDRILFRRSLPIFNLSSENDQHTQKQIKMMSLFKQLGQREDLKRRYSEWAIDRDNLDIRWMENQKEKDKGKYTKQQQSDEHQDQKEENQSDKSVSSDNLPTLVSNPSFTPFLPINQNENKQSQFSSIKRNNSQQQLLSQSQTLVPKSSLMKSPFGLQPSSLPLSQSTSQFPISNITNNILEQQTLSKSLSSAPQTSNQYYNPLDIHPISSQQSLQQHQQQHQHSPPSQSQSQSSINSPYSPISSQPQQNSPTFSSFLQKMHSRQISLPFTEQSINSYNNQNQQQNQHKADEIIQQQKPIKLRQNLFGNEEQTKTNQLITKYENASNCPQKDENQQNSNNITPSDILNFPHNKQNQFHSNSLQYQALNDKDEQSPNTIHSQQQIHSSPTLQQSIIASQSFLSPKPISPSLNRQIHNDQNQSNQYIQQLRIQSPNIQSRISPIPISRLSPPSNTRISPNNFSSFHQLPLHNPLLLSYQQTTSLSPQQQSHHQFGSFVQPQNDQMIPKSLSPSILSPQQTQQQSIQSHNASEPENDSAKFLLHSFQFFILTPLLYEKHQQYTLSDHRPVSAIFSLQPSDNIQTFEGSNRLSVQRLGFKADNIMESDEPELLNKYDENYDFLEFSDQTAKLASQFLLHTSEIPKWSFKGTIQDGSDLIIQEIKSKWKLDQEKEKDGKK